MTDSQDFPARTQFQKQVADLLETHPDADILDLAARLVVPIVPGEDKRCAPNYQAGAVARALFAKEVAGWSYPELERRLADNPTAAMALGFDEDTPEQSSFWKYWNSGYISEDLKLSIHRKARWTRNRALEENHPIGDSALIPEPSQDISKRTESRLIREKLKTVSREILRLVADEWDFLPDRASNAQYHRNAFLEMMTVMGVQRLAAEQGSEIYGDSTDRSSGSPDGDTLLHYIGQSSREDILRRSRNSTGLIVNRMKQYLGFDRPVDIAIDYTDFGYYGQDRDSKWVWDRSGYDAKSHNWATRYASVSIVGDNVRAPLGFVPVPVGKSIGSVVKELVELARQHVSVDTVYADRMFATSDVIRILNNQPVEYTIPVPKNSRIKNEIVRMRNDVKVVENYGFYGDQGELGTKVRTETTLALVPSSRNEDSTACFYTSVDVDDATTVGRSRTERVINRYRRRWGIETHFSSLKTFLPWTSSNNHVIRMFHFAFGMLLYNLWRLVDFLVQESMDGYETRYKPRVKSKRFINAIYSMSLLA